MPELALRLRIGVFEAAERLLDLRRRPLRQRTGGGPRRRPPPAWARPSTWHAWACAPSGCVPSPKLLPGTFLHNSGIVGVMIPDNGSELEPTIFSATLTPHRSLGRAGFLILMLLFGGISFVTGMLFLVIGAWPVLGFFGLDVLLLYLAFRLNYWHAEAYEEVTVTPSVLKVRKVSHLGRAREWALNPLWVRLDKVELDEFGHRPPFSDFARQKADDRKLSGPR